MAHRHAYPIARYLNMQAATDPNFMPDGERIVFICNITGIPQVWITELPVHGNQQWPDQLTFAENRVQVVQTSSVTGDTRIIFARDAGGNENAQLFLLDTKTGIETCLTDGHDSSMHIPGCTTKDASTLSFAANRRNPGLFDLYIQPLDGEARIIWQNERPGFLFNHRFSPDGTRILSTLMAGSFDTYLFETHIEDGEARMISPDDVGVRYASALYAPDGETVYVCTDYQSDFLYLAKLNIETRAITPLIQRKWDLEGIMLSKDGRYLAYAVNENGASKLYRYDTETGETISPQGFDMTGTLSSGGSFSPDGSRLVFDYAHATRVSNIYVWEFASNTVEQVTRVSQGGIPQEAFIAPEPVYYPTFDTDEAGKTRQIPAWLFKPGEHDSSPMPVVVIVHGGPESQSRPAFSFLIQYLLHSGYAVFVPNVRGSTGYGKAYSHLDDVEKRMDSVADLAHAAHWLKAQPDIDGDRIIVYGGSYGGFMVLSALTAYPDLWAAGVDIVGISSLVTFLENTSAYRRAVREAEYGSLERDRTFLESIAPITHIDNISAPLMIIHGANDPRVPLSEAEQFAAALEARDIPVQLLVFDDEGHGVIKLKNKLVMYPQVVEFLSKHV